MCIDNLIGNPRENFGAPKKLALQFKKMDLDEHVCVVLNGPAYLITTAKANKYQTTNKIAMSSETG